LETGLIIAFAVVGLFVVATLVGNSQPRANQSSPLATPVVAKEVISPDVIYNLVNEQRVKNGSSPLERSPELNASAKAKCDDMVSSNYYGHTHPATGKHGYTFIFDNYKGAGYGSENLNQGDLTSNQAYIDSWLNSPSHKAAMLDPQYSKTGVAVCTVSGQDTIVQHFFNPKQQTQVQYVPSPAPVPTYTPPRTCFTNYYKYTDSASTTCY